VSTSGHFLTPGKTDAGTYFQSADDGELALKQIVEDTSIKYLLGGGEGINSVANLGSLRYHILTSLDEPGSNHIG